MAPNEHIDDILRGWGYEPHTLSVRLVEGDDGRDLIQMRIDMGILQIETSGKPDGTQPEGFETYLDYVEYLSEESDDWQLDEDQCVEIDREFVQYYHRRVCWLKLQRFADAVDDANHTLHLMDFCRRHSSDESWSMSHEQYRPFVVFHRTQAAAFEFIEHDDHDGAIDELNRGLEVIRGLYEDFDVEEQFEDDELVVRLIELRESLVQQYDADARLKARLREAVEKEQYELAAQLRDQLAQRGAGD